jgi:hypothetical protein
MRKKYPPEVSEVVKALREKRARVVDQFLRRSKISVKEAIELDELQGIVQLVRRGAGVALLSAKFRHLLRVTEATSRFPERDTLILLLGVIGNLNVAQLRLSRRCGVSPIERRNIAMKLLLLW